MCLDFLLLFTINGKIRILTIDGKEQQKIKAHDFEINSICFSPNSQQIASASGDHLVKIWSLSGKLLGCFSKHKTWVTSVCFSPDGSKIISSSADGKIKCCRIDDTQETYLQFWEDSKGIRIIKWSTDGEKIASVSINDVVRIWSSKGKLLKVFEASAKDICFSPDSQSIALGMANGTIQIRSLNNEQIYIFTKHSSKVNSLYFSSDGNTITSASIDGTVKCWDLEGNDLKSLRGPGNWLKNICLSPNGQNIASITVDNSLIWWNSNLNFDPNYLLKRGSDWAKGYLRNNPDISESNRNFEHF